MCDARRELERRLGARAARAAVDELRAAGFAVVRDEPADQAIVAAEVTE